MSGDPLELLTIAYLRGSTGKFLLPFDPRKKLTVVYGENASGKSTVCDGFELLGAGKVGSLEGRGLGQTGRYWPSIGKTSSDIEVVLKTRAASYRATVSPRGEVTIDPELDRPFVDVLRRSQIVSLILATEADRYKEIARFIDVAAIQLGEAALSAALKSTDDGQKIAIARVSENRGSMENFWGQAGNPGGDALTWARAQFPRTTDSSRHIAALLQLQGAFDRLLDHPRQLREAADAITAAEADLAEARTARRAEALRSSQDPGPTLQLLEAADHFFEGHPNPATCPLCESPDRAAGLAEAVKEKLTSFASLQTAVNRETEAETALERARQRLAAVGETASRAGEQFAVTAKSADLPEGTIVPRDDISAGADGLVAWLETASPMREAWETARRALDDDIRFYGTLEEALKTYDENVLLEADLSALLPKLKLGLAIVSEERHSYVDGKLAAIADDVGKLYERVHPGEGLEKISLALNPRQRASLMMGASFQGREAPPQAYFSDSHLDTLGLCIFIALAKQEKAAEKVLVLDDVLGSVDEPHVERLIEMICKEAENFRHCVITTHYRPWKEKLRWGWLQTGQCHFVELAPWSSANGLALIRTLPDIERLRVLLAEQPPDPQLICSKAGVILEAALDFLTLLYECPVPRKRDDEYTLGDLLPAISNKLREALKVEVCKAGADGTSTTYETVELKPILDELSRIMQARNAMGAHFKEISFHMLDADAVGFGAQVLLLMDTLTDQEAGWPKNDRSGSYWATSGETRRLHPLRRPS